MEYFKILEKLLEIAGKAKLSSIVKAALILWIIYLFLKGLGLRFVGFYFR